VTDDYGLSHQLGMLEQLDRCEERVHVDVQQVCGQVVDGVGGDLPPAAVLLAHAAILSPAAVT
jgi:hypothetical protein